MTPTGRGQGWWRWVTTSQRASPPPPTERLEGQQAQAEKRDQADENPNDGAHKRRHVGAQDNPLLSNHGGGAFLDARRGARALGRAPGTPRRPDREGQIAEDS
jgi:hypothetical protein